MVTLKFQLPTATPGCGSASRSADTAGGVHARETTIDPPKNTVKLSSRDLLKTLAISNYRSLRDFVMPLGPLNLITGPNGSGKSNVYRALRLLADTANGSVVGSLAREGGISSTLWAGPATQRKDPVALRLGFHAKEFSYAIDLGLPKPSESAFSLDPEIKSESIWHGAQLRPATLLVERRNGLVRIRRANGEWDIVESNLQPFESMMERIADPHRAAEVMSLRDQIRSWRFYDHFRTDAEAPARQVQIGTYTPVLAHDGRDLAAAMQTIREIGDAVALDLAISDAFPGAKLEIGGRDGRLSVGLRQEGLLRPLDVGELSDGTLRYLLWSTALLTPRPPQLMVLNEPESSLHPDLLPALARLIGVAAKQTQVWVVSHASRLIAALKESEECRSIELEKESGETIVLGQGALDRPAWKWPAR
jgi:predicted ATPase